MIEVLEVQQTDEEGNVVVFYYVGDNIFDTVEEAESFVTSKKEGA